MIQPLPRYFFIAVRLLYLFIVYALCRLVFYWWNIDLFPNVSGDELLTIFWGGLRFDLTGILYLNILYIMIIALPFKFVYSHVYQKWSNRFFIGMNSIGILANCVDMAYFPFTMHRTTGSVFKIFENEETGTLVSVFLNGFLDFWPITVFAIIMIYGLIWFTRNTVIQESESTGKVFYFGYSFAILLAFYLSIIGIRSGFGLKHVRPLAINHAGAYVSSTHHISIVLNTPFSILRTLRQETYQRKSYFSESEVESIFSPIKTINGNEDKNLKNVVILVIESLSKEHSAFLNPKLENGEFKGHTPFLDSLMQESLTFMNGFASGHKSIDGMPAVLAGIPPIKSHYVISNYSTNKIEGIGKILNRFGYDQAFFHGAPNGSMGFGAFANLLGIEKYYGMSEFDDSSKFDGTWGIWDEDFLYYMADELENMKPPFHATFFSLSSHHPYDVPDKYEGQFKRGKHGLTKVIKYTDFALRQFFKYAKTKSWYSNTLFVITADHASVPYHDEYRNSAGIYKVPIIFYTPDQSLKGLDYRVAQQLDIFPTVLDYLKLPTSYFSFGSSLLDSTETRYAVSYMRNGTYQFFNDSLLYKFKGNKKRLYRYREDLLLKNDVYEKADNPLDTLSKAVLQQFYNRMIDNQLTPNGL